MGTPAQRMVAEQLRPHGVTDERVLQAMASVPREEFLAPRMRRHAYEDRALAIDCGQTISQPLVVALMTQAASPQPDDIALEVGTGSGYAAAILSRLCRKVITIEREPALAEHASETLRRLGFDNAEVAVGDGNLGWPGEAPYQVILVAAAAPGVPQALIDQLADGGRMVIPVEVSTNEPQDLRVYTRRADGVSYRSLFPVLFVPLRPG
jgi:protein-L-isoaspartate(D-aspartate) O-methyltransferase